MNERGLIEAVVAAPDDTQLRLIYADWLEEHGQLERAALIRSECELVGVPHYDPRWLAHLETVRRVQVPLPTLPDGIEWPPFPFERGFPSRLYVRDLDVLLAHAEDVFRCAPIRALEVAGGASQVMRLLELPALRNIVQLDLSRCLLEPTHVVRLAGAEHLPRLARLGFDYASITGEGLKTLVQSPLAARLSALSIRHAFAFEYGLPIWEAFRDRPVLPALRVLKLRGNRIEVGVLAGVLRASLPQLVELDLDDNPLGDSGCQMLAASSVAPRLEVLKLSQTIPRVSVVGRLASELTGLRAVTLSGNGLGPDAGRAIAGAVWRELRYLDMSNNYLGDAGISALLHSSGFPRLVRADLANNGTSDAVAELARGWPHELSG